MYLLKKEIAEFKTRLNQLEDDRRTLEKQIIEINHTSSLVFDSIYGTWNDTASELRYCAACKATHDKLSPLQTTFSGWSCPSCGAVFRDKTKPSTYMSKPNFY